MPAGYEYQHANVTPDVSATIAYPTFPVNYEYRYANGMAITTELKPWPAVDPTPFVTTPYHIVTLELRTDEAGNVLPQQPVKD